MISTPLQLLIVENREHRAVWMLSELRRAGYEPVSQRVSTREMFIAQLKQHAWDVALVNCSIPLFSTANAIDAARSLHFDLPFVVVAGAIGEEAAVSAIKAGASDYVCERNLSQLGQVIDRALIDAELRRERKRTRKKLAERDALFRAVLENVSDLIVILDREGFIRYQSPSVSRVLGYGPDELIGKPGLDYLHHAERTAAIDALTHPAQLLQDVVLINCQVKNEEGGWCDLEGTATNLLAHPTVDGIVLNLRDVTERRRTQRQRALAQRMESIGNLAGGIAHDLNNLLTPILVASEMLQEELPEADREILLHGLKNGAQRATEVVHRLLSFARGMQTDQGIGHVVDLIRETEPLLRFGFPKSITVQTTLPDSVWPVRIGATEFVQLLMNLCVNARDAMPDGGRLCLSVENVAVEPRDAGITPGIPPGRYVVLNVVDSGVGIPLDIQQRIFDPYFTTKGNQGGTGLGLSTTQEILKSHGGLIQVDSVVGAGTRFAVYIPAVASPETTAAELSIPFSPTGQGELILVIGNEASMREVLKETLEAHNYRVVTASDGPIGLLLYRGHAQDIDLVIVELTTPIMDDQATITEIRDVNPKARILLHSALVSKCCLSLLNPHTADVFLKKPCTTDELLNGVHDLLQRKRDNGNN